MPWLRPYLAETVRELLGGARGRPERVLSMPDLGDLRGLVDKVREGDVATLIVGPERRATLDRMQAFMAVLEGYAEHVMDAVGAQVLPDLPKLRGALDRRRRDRSGLLRIFEKLIGMDLKLRQYEQGKKFCDAVVKAGGIEALNRVWHGPEQMPTIGELDDPDGWLRRTTSGITPRSRRTPDRRCGQNTRSSCYKVVPGFPLCAGILPAPCNKPPVEVYKRVFAGYLFIQRT